MPRISLLVPLAALVLLASACGSSVRTAALPTELCKDTLDVGTACVPPDSSYVRTAFEGATTAEDVSVLMDDGRLGGTLVCGNKRDDSIVCLVGGSGAVQIVPLVIPPGRQARFTGGLLDGSVDVDLVVGEPVGVRYEGPSVKVEILNTEGTTLYSLNSAEVALVDSSGAEADG